MPDSILGSKGMAGLKAFKDLAHLSLKSIQGRGPTKRTRMTEVGVSPYTTKVRPSSTLAAKKLYFFRVSI